MAILAQKNNIVKNVVQVYIVVYNGVVKQPE